MSANNMRFFVIGIFAAMVLASVLFDRGWKPAAPARDSICTAQLLDTNHFATTTIITMNTSRAYALAARMNGYVTVVQGSSFKDSRCKPQRHREGCTLAHLGVLRRIADSTAKTRWHLVLEDDAVPSEELVCTPWWAKEIVRVALGAEAINLGPSHPYPAYGELFRHPFTMLKQYMEYAVAPAGKVVMRGWNAWAHAYMIKPSAAARVIAYVHPRMCENHWDVIMGHGARWDPDMQFVARVYDKAAHYPLGTWRNYGVFGQSDDHLSLTK